MTNLSLARCSWTRAARTVLGSALFVVAWTIGAGTAGRAENFKTLEKCNVAHYDKAFLKANVASMSWSGGCVKGKADGTGILVVTMKEAGRVDRYEGAMREGDFHGEGSLSELRSRGRGGRGAAPGADSVGRRIAGEFDKGRLDKGKLYNEDGRLVFEGRFSGLFPFSPFQGKAFFLSGGYVDGMYLNGAEFFDASLTGLAYGTLYDDRGVVYRRVVEGVQYPLVDVYDANGAPSGMNYRNAIEAYQNKRYYQELETLGALGAAETAAEEQGRARDRALTAAITSAAVGAVAAVVTPSTSTARATAPAPAPRAAAERPMQTAVASAASCVSYQGLEHRLGYQYQQVTNTCGFGILVAFEIRVNGELREYDTAGGHIFAGQTNKNSFGRLASDRWTATFKYACPDKEEVARQTGRRVANANWQTGRGCYATFEPDPVGVVR